MWFTNWDALSWMYSTFVRSGPQSGQHIHLEADTMRHQMGASKTWRWTTWDAGQDMQRMKRASQGLEQSLGVRRGCDLADVDATKGSRTPSGREGFVDGDHLRSVGS